ncbi:Uncharacterized protein FWK35_00011967, partial [Aphis craccivora]
MYFVENQHASIRDAPSYLNISCSCVQRTLKKQSKFMSNGILNRHNAHYWTDEYPHLMRKSIFQTFAHFYNGQNAYCSKIPGVSSEYSSNTTRKCTTCNSPKYVFPIRRMSCTQCKSMVEMYNEFLISKI